LKLADALRVAEEKKLDLIEIAPQANPPVARIMSFDKFRYRQEKEEKKQKQARRGREMKQVRISPRAALNDLQIKARLAEEFLKEGLRVEINLFLRGREKTNKDWNFQKLREFLDMIKIPYQVTMEPKMSGRGLVTQIVKK
jgi:translation initiation factor IF-3